LSVGEYETYSKRKKLNALTGTFFYIVAFIYSYSVIQYRFTLCLE